jgi:hypothetical protein
LPARNDATRRRPRPGRRSARNAEDPIVIGVHPAAGPRWSTAGKCRRHVPAP